MLKKVKIQNFQSHKDTELEFSKGVNVIAGQSDSGKTAILRALRWVFNNKPQGDSFRSHWGGDTEVTVEFDDGFVTRGRHKKNDNFYGWHKDEKQFKAFGTNVPEPLVEYMDIDSVNVQSQLDPPFLLSETPGEVAKYLNNIANLSLIDSATYNINSKHREIEDEIKLLEKGKESLQTKLERFKEFDEIDRKQKELEALYNIYVLRCEEVSSLNKLITEVESINKTIKKNEKYLELEDLVLKSLQLHENKRELNFSVETYEKLDGKIHKANKYVSMENNVTTLLKKTDDLKAVKFSYSMLYRIEKDLSWREKWISLEKKVNNAISFGDEFVKIKNGLSEFKGLVTMMTKLSSDIKEQEEYISDSEERFHAEMPDICPLCDQPIEEKINV